MNYYLLTILFLLASPLASAVTFKVIGKEGQILFNHQESIKIPDNVGNTTINFLNQNEISFKGNASGISEIFGLGSDMEIISNTEIITKRFIKM